jgi:hypothetical protein
MADITYDLNIAMAWVEWLDNLRTAWHQSAQIHNPLRLDSITRTNSLIYVTILLGVVLICAPTAFHNVVMDDSA